MADMQQAMLNSKTEILHTPGANTKAVSGNLADIAAQKPSSSKVIILFRNFLVC